jgi:hypothetical protein
VAQADIAGGDGQADDLVTRIVERHQQGQRVVDARVGIDQQGDFRHRPIMRESCARHARGAAGRVTATTRRACFPAPALHPSLACR